MIVRRSDIVRLAEDICIAVNVPVPDIIFVDKQTNRCLHNHIEVSRPEWWVKSYGVGEQEGYPVDYVIRIYHLTALHEIAHWVEQHLTGDTRHSPTMYAILYTIAHRWGYDLKELQRIEKHYKPRSSKQGWRLYQDWVNGLTEPAIPTDNATPNHGHTEEVA